MNRFYQLIIKSVVLKHTNGQGGSGIKIIPTKEDIKEYLK